MKRLALLLPLLALAAAPARAADPATNAPAATPAAVRPPDRPAIAGLAVTNDGDGMLLTEEAVIRLSRAVRKGKRIARKPLAWEGRGRFPVEETSVYVRTVKQFPEVFEKQYEFSWGLRFVEVTSRFIPIKTTVIDHETSIEFVEEPKGPFCSNSTGTCKMKSRKFSTGSRLKSRRGRSISTILTKRATRTGETKSNLGSKRMKRSASSSTPPQTRPPRLKRT